ncbi:MAG: bifunctional precorrin-2 dehydrogenase/sirohydrochlorin ferrochelatase [Saprospiraceae bacterium]|nr:bifunctional precorrin-2 dehydrogenase/sirohydrochlorin ferrochelatase [Saprospiraceae bacterium]
MINSEPKGNELYPIFLKLHQLHTLIVGGGNVGLEKLESLLKSSPRAKITMVASEVRRSEIWDLEKQFGSFTVIAKPFENVDLVGKDLVICASDDRNLHEHIRKLARDMNMVINVADTPDLCDFYLGSIVKKGDMKIAISTNGKSPTLAKRMREYLTEALPEADDVQQLLDSLKDVRDQLGGDFEYKVKKLNEITSSWLEDAAGKE